ncbi:Replication-associated recombination protein A [uncultured Ruminococcus sp.]|uniref:Replication-associated recombination protein A n=1 Tax=Massiliimalia timonensis TaxID=1987501 RepID=A0A8J6P3V6_9FIRM|nr:replication-associated recombination protein A [Massiliimalia timonensis]MBC8610668.1 replication-associated recombination protein A [Massiliimalia timonensis]SCH93846.1 Replication-associated recombination protein A [uncultured Clostridium sp.]SCI26498.1 Replication-associated recombination protein A [uncultured Ruminococcus sp.]
MSAPLADRIRPQTLDEVVGQTHLLAPGKPLRTIIESGQIPNLIFYGPSGVGKTTLARLIAGQTNKKLYKLNGTSASTADIKAIIDQVNTISSYQGILLYLDEIQYLNKKQQQSLLEHIENGNITLIASTTENPYFYIYNAILSRSTVFEFRPIEPQEAARAVTRAFQKMEEELDSPIRLEEGVAEFIGQACGGDVRKSLNTVELCVLATRVDEAGGRLVTLETARELAQKSAMKYDRQGDEHYDLLSALQKSIRGSDPDAAVHYLGRLLEAGDLLSPCRRLLVIASEDIGMAYPLAITIVKACVDSAVQLGLPEARIPLAEAAVLLATSPKSNSSYMAINQAMADIRAGKGGTFPRQLQNKHFDGAEREVKGQNYQYPHDFPNHYIKQQYLPDDLKDTVYYHYGENKNEQAAKAYWDKIKK